MLHEYYEAVGRVVAKFGGTIKDYAGDGILILVDACTRELAGEHALRPRPSIQVKGFAEPVLLYALADDASDQPDRPYIVSSQST